MSERVISYRRYARYLGWMGLACVLLSPIVVPGAVFAMLTGGYSPGELQRIAEAWDGLKRAAWDLAA